jgi:nitrite reductase/ring-hydroxylating ferredoxin subunit
MTEPPGGFVAVASTADIPPGGMKCVAHVDGRFYALSDVCGHRNAPLSRGRLSGHTVECPLHFAQFDVRDGKLVDGPISTDVPAYEVRIDGDTILLRR